ncbi:MAG TPA: tail fiber domain-containing protein [Candidatus Acidoferrum sp.]|nr:tail fiber domain-containing protein [Candidatus Acidoferrum sp.]
MKTRLVLRGGLGLVLLASLNPCLRVCAQGTAFTYQGFLQDGGQPANGIYDLTFAVFAATNGGSAVAGPITNSAVGVTNGMFIVALDFGAGPFSLGAPRWLEIAARTNGAGGFTTLSPRQRLLATPYAITAGNLTGTVANSQLANNSLAVNAGAGLGGGGVVPLGGSTTLSNTGVISVTGDADITATTIGGAVTLGDTATDADTPSTLVKRDATGSFSAASLSLDGNLSLPGTSAAAGIIYSAGVPFVHRFGENNFFAGFGAGNFTMSGAFNTGVGYQALAGNTSGDGNAAFGLNALLSNGSGSHNTAAGLDALASNTQASDNAAFGSYALQNNTVGNWNTAVGADSLSFNTNGANNTAVGFQAMQSNKSGNDNAALGVNALQKNTTGGANTAVGTSALLANTTAYYSTAVGQSALQDATIGGENTALGAFALYQVTTGSGNIAIGVNSGQAIFTGSNDIDIGNDGFGDESNAIRIGTTYHTKAVMGGIYGATVATGGTAVYINPSGLLGTITSSARFKKNIRSMADASAVLLALRPVTFTYKPELDPAGTPQFGLVAEEVEKVDPNLVVRDAKGQLYSVRYEAVNAMLLNEFLKEHRKVEAQGSEIADLKARLERLERIVGAGQGLEP